MKNEDEKKRKAFRILIGEWTANHMKGIKELEETVSKATKDIKQIEKPFFVQLAEDQKTAGDGSSMAKLGDAQRKARAPMFGLKANRAGPPINEPPSLLAKLDIPDVTKKPPKEGNPKYLTTDDIDLVLDFMGKEFEKLYEKLLKTVIPRINEFNDGLQEALEKKEIEDQVAWAQKAIQSIKDLGLFISKN